MKLPQDLARLPAEAGARHVALAHLKDTAAAYHRLTTKRRDEDPEALHDFRVALRRLRSCLRAYRPQLRTSVSKRSYARLRRLAGATRKSRDLEVHLAWVRGGKSEPAGHTGVAHALAGRLDSAERRMRQRLDRRFRRAHRRLERQLERLVIDAPLDGSVRDRTMATVTGRLVAERSASLRSALAGIQSIEDRDAIHQARIAGKRLRYLLEPFEVAVPAVAGLLTRLTAFQDIFGDLHDVQVFGDELDESLGTLDHSDPHRATLATLRSRLDERGREAFGVARAEWLDGHADPFFDEVAEVADAITALGGGDREIERKYLLSALPPLDSAHVEEIEQGYLPGERVVERLRHVRANGTERYLRTVKSGAGVSRVELEEPVDAATFARLWPLTDGRRLRKRRYHVREGDRVWEVDEYLDRELFVAEIELGAEQEEVHPPAWLEPLLVREVTGDVSYSNRELAR
ncbi:MAG: CHAD domain-containing protein [Bacillota bacterium]|jgi:CHAD domain-containing protein/CYTH domain-containing protein